MLVINIPNFDKRMQLIGKDEKKSYNRLPLFRILKTFF
jgi:hypothetical protein